MVYEKNVGLTHKENKIHETYRKQVAKWQMSIQQYQYYIKYESTKDFNQTYKWSI